MIVTPTHITQEQKLPQCLILYVHTQIISSMPGTWMVRRSTAVIPTGTIGRLRRAVAAAPTPWASAVAASTQARTSASSTTGVWRVASLAPRSYCII